MPIQDEYEEARRLCMYEGRDGRACEALLLGDGKHCGSMTKGNAPSSIVCAREGLDMAIQKEVEAVAGDVLTAEAGDDKRARGACLTNTHQSRMPCLAVACLSTA